MATGAVRELLRQRKHEEFVVWVDAMRLRAAMQAIHLDRITENEWKEYEKPTAGVFK